MKSKKGYVHVAAVITIVIIAILMVSVAVYYDANETIVVNEQNNSNTNYIVNGSLVNYPDQSAFRQRVIGGQACEKNSDCWQYTIGGTIDECTYGNVTGTPSRLMKDADYSFFNQTGSACINNICELLCQIFTTTDTEVEIDADVTQDDTMESCEIGDDGVDPCQDGMVCNWSQECPKGGTCGEVTGDLLCHTVCESDEDCSESAPNCNEVNITRGDVSHTYSICVK
ncbi:hypothetical protein ACFL0L_01705 [Patescibacteria group bacterium]